jgi:hypothetical protein
MVGSLAHINRQGRLIEHVGELSESKFVEFLEHSTHDLNALLGALRTVRGQVSESLPDRTLAAAAYRIARLLEAERGMIYRLFLPILDREAGLFGVVQLLPKRGGPFTAEDAARLQESLCPLSTIPDACCRPAHLGQAYTYA